MGFGGNADAAELPTTALCLHGHVAAYRIPMSWHDVPGARTTPGGSLYFCLGPSSLADLITSGTSAGPET